MVTLVLSFIKRFKILRTIEQEFSDSYGFVQFVLCFIKFLSLNLPILIWGCGFERQNVLSSSHRDKIQGLMAPNLARLAQYAFVTSAQLTAADQSNSNAFFLVVPTLPRGALIEIAPHYSQGWNFKLQNLFL